MDFMEWATVTAIESCKCKQRNLLKFMMLRHLDPMVSKKFRTPGHLHVLCQHSRLQYASVSCLH